MNTRAFDPLSRLGAMTDAAATAATVSAEKAEERPAKLRWLREPLLHFMLLGALLYGAAQFYAPDRTDTQIVVDAARVARLATLYELQTGSAPDAEQREKLVQSFLREEVLYREARKHRLDEGDELVRRRLVQKMEFLRTAVAVSEPGDAELRALLATGPDRFAAPAKASFEHRYFNPDRLGSSGARDAARAALQTIDGTSSAGDRPPLPVYFVAKTREELALAFGQRPIVDAVFSATPNVWTGPVESGFGWHLIRVHTSSPAAPPSFEQARPALIEAWRQEARRRDDAAWIDGLQAQYRIVRADRGAAQP